MLCDILSDKQSVNTAFISRKNTKRAFMYKDGIEVFYFAYKPDGRLFVSLKRMTGQALRPDAIRVYLTCRFEDADTKSDFENRVIK